jgi:hypothetical protein
MRRGLFSAHYRPLHAERAPVPDATGNLKASTSSLLSTTSVQIFDE